VLLLLLLLLLRRRRLRLLRISVPFCCCRCSCWRWWYIPTKEPQDAAATAAPASADADSAASALVMRPAVMAVPQLPPLLRTLLYVSCSAANDTTMKPQNPRATATGSNAFAPVVSVADSIGMLLYVALQGALQIILLLLLLLL
jgi:hypothetical protein